MLVNILSPKKGWERVDQDGEGFEVVTLICPKCGKRSTLWSPIAGHAISEEGMVSPSVVCPFEPCTYHEIVQRDGWTFGARERKARA